MDSLPDDFEAVVERTPLAGDIEVLFNPELQTPPVLVPALAGLVLAFVGTIEQLAVMPFRPHDVPIGKVAPYLLVAELQVDRPRVRVSLVASQLLGIAMARYVIRLEPRIAACAGSDRAVRAGASGVPHGITRTVIQPGNGRQDRVWVA